MAHYELGHTYNPIKSILSLHLTNSAHCSSSNKRVADIYDYYYFLVYIKVPNQLLQSSLHLVLLLDQAECLTAFDLK
jgi:hypothetical protein